MSLIPATSDSFRKIRVKTNLGATEGEVAADSIVDTLNLIAGTGLQITSNEAGDAITISTVGAPNTAGLNDILYNGTVSGYGITVASVQVDETLLNGNSIVVDDPAHDLTLSTTGTGIVKVGKTIESQSIIPVTDITYDLGASDKRFRHLYLSGSSIYLGSATITASGSSIVLPAGTTVAGTSFVDSVIPEQTSSTNKFLRTNGTNIYWADIPTQFPDQSGATGKSLTSNGSTVQWTLITPTTIGLGNVANESKATMFSNPTFTGTVELSSIRTSATNLTIESGLGGFTPGYNRSRIDLASNGFNDYVATNANYTHRFFVGGTHTFSIPGTVGGNGWALTTDGAGACTWTEISPSSLGVDNVTNESKTTMFTDSALTGTTTVNTLNITNALGLEYGGTGANNTGDALTNLLPAGGTAGYVLKTGGSGSYYWAAETGASTIVGTRIDTQRQTFVASPGQTLFTFTSATYTPGAGQLRVYIRGVRQHPDAYTETDGTSFTLSAGVTGGTTLFAEVDGFVSNEVTATAVTVTPVGGIGTTNVQDALSELDTEKAPKASPAFTGTPSLPTGTTGVTQTAGDNSTKLATTAYVKTEIDNLIGAAPAALNTLSELSDALSDDSNFAGTVASSIATRAPSESPTLTGTTTVSTVLFAANGFSIVQTGTKLVFSYNGVDVMSVDSSGNVITKANITAYGTP